MTTTVEDVDYLQKHGSRESHLLLVDSTFRNTIDWPTPSEYEVEFETPFRHVYGIDVIDVNIPRTQYNVDIFNNTLSFRILQADHEISIEPADYEITDLIIELNEKLAPYNISAQHTYRKDARTSTRSIKNTLTFISPIEFSIDMNRSTLSNILGFMRKVTYQSSPSPSEKTNVVSNPEGKRTAELSLQPNQKVRQKFGTTIPGKPAFLSVRCRTTNPTFPITFSILDEDDTVYAHGSIPAGIIMQTVDVNVTPNTSMQMPTGNYFIVFSSPVQAYVSVGQSTPQSYESSKIPSNVTVPKTGIITEDKTREIQVIQSYTIVKWREDTKTFEFDVDAPLPEGVVVPPYAKTETRQRYVPISGTTTSKGTASMSGTMTMDGTVDMGGDINKPATFVLTTGDDGVETKGTATASWEDGSSTGNISIYTASAVPVVGNVSITLAGTDVTGNVSAYTASAVPVVGNVFVTLAGTDVTGNVSAYTNVTTPPSISGNISIDAADVKIDGTVSADGYFEASKQTQLTTSITTGPTGQQISLITEIDVINKDAKLVAEIDAETQVASLNVDVDVINKYAKLVAEIDAETQVASLNVDVDVINKSAKLVAEIDAETQVASLSTEIDIADQPITLSHSLDTENKDAIVTVTMDTIGETALEGEFTFEGTQTLAGDFTSTEGEVDLEGSFEMQYELQTYQVYTWTKFGDWVEYEEGDIPEGVDVPGDAQKEIRQRLITVEEDYTMWNWIDNDIPEELRAQYFDSDGEESWLDIQPHSQIEATFAFKKHAVEAPGIYNLTGDPYLQIRCKEIEQHLFRTRAYEKYNTGLAKVQLGIFGYGNERFDYFSFPPREFHPIGKLTKMTLRFERPNGQLYDFKGLDHNITIVVRYWVIKKAQFNTQILNPAYNPNLLEYENANSKKI